MRETFYSKYGKRSIDFVLSAAGAVVLLPVLAGTAVAVKLDSPGPVLFSQERIGKGKKHFKIYKFRTMRSDTPHDVPTHMMENPDYWVTRTGKFLRRTSMDELPQLWNIIKGDMSIIGPRPALWNQNDLIVERDTYGANDVLPGLTGWAQINGRDELEIPVKAKLDGEYVRNLSFAMDVRCFIGTIGCVIGGKGIQEGSEGTPERSSSDQPAAGKR